MLVETAWSFLTRNPSKSSKLVIPLLARLCGTQALKLTLHITGRPAPLHHSAILCSLSGYRARAFFLLASVSGHFDKSDRATYQPPLPLIAPCRSPIGISENFLLTLFLPANATSLSNQFVSRLLPYHALFFRPHQKEGVCAGSSLANASDCWGLVD